MNLATVIVLLIVLGMVVYAIYVLHSGKGSCSCGEQGKPTARSGGCSHCTADCPFRR